MTAPNTPTPAILELLRDARASLDEVRAEASRLNNAAGRTIFNPAAREAAVASIAEIDAVLAAPLALTRERGRVLGKEAHAKGIHAAPALDPEAMRVIAANPGLPVGSSTAFLDGWTSAWHEANAAAPLVPASERP